MNNPRYPAQTMAFAPLQTAINHRGTSHVTLSDIGLNANSKILELADVGADLQAAHLEIAAIRIEFTATATAGNRILSVRIERRTVVPAILYEIAIPNETLQPNQSRTWQLAPGVTETTVPPMLDVQEVNLPPRLYCSGAQRLVIEDSADIDTDDTLIVHIMGRLFIVRSL